MCGRFHFGIIDTPIGKQISQKAQKLNLVFANGEIFPTNEVLCIIPKESKIDLTTMKWGIKAKSLLINAKIETIDERPTYNAIKHNRCAIVANGFYEWDKDKNKYFISYPDDYVYFACIFNQAHELVILTKAASDDFKYIHERMPIVMNKKEMLNFVHNRDDIFTDKKMNIKRVDEDLKLF